MIDYVLQKISLGLLYFYQKLLSPDKGVPSLRLRGRVCMHEPHCSEYSKQCLQRYGFFASISKITHRIFSCTGGMHKIYDPSSYKVVFFSSAPIGIPFLEELYKDPRFDVTGVVTMPDAPAGRGMQLQENAIKKIASNLKIQIQTPTKINPEKSEEGKQFSQRLQDQKPDFLVVIAYGKIIPQSILDISRIASINIHGSILPKYRGASPIQSALRNLDPETGITIIKMQATLDTGPIIDILKCKQNFERTAADVIEHMKKIGPKFLTKTLRNYGKGLLGETQQDNTQATLCSKIDKEDGRINMTDTLQTVFAKYKAFFLWPKIYISLQDIVPGQQDKRIIIEQLSIDETMRAQYKDEPRLQNTQLNPAITDIQIKVEGSGKMSRPDFVHGYHKKI